MKPTSRSLIITAEAGMKPLMLQMSSWAERYGFNAKTAAVYRSQAKW